MYDQYVPWLYPVGEELSVHSRLDHYTLRSQEGHGTSRISHSIKVNEILVLPMFGQWYGLGKAIVLHHPLAASGKLVAPNRLGESGVHEVVIHRL